MRAGSLDRRVAILRRTAGADDGYGNIAVAWTTVATVWASVSYPSGGETHEAGAWQHAAQLILQTRWRDVSTDDRIEHDGVVYAITDVRPIGRREGIEIHCGTAQGEAH